MSNNQADGKPEHSGSSNAGGPPEYTIGYCRPPIAHQYPKGTSGNLKGRPKKRERSRSARQFNTDVLAAANEMVTMLVNGKKVRVTMFQANILRVHMDGARGHLPSAKFAIELDKEAALDRAHLNREFHNLLEATELNTLMRAEYPPDKNVISFLDYERKKSRQI